MGAFKLFSGLLCFALCSFGTCQEGTTQQSSTISSSHASTALPMTTDSPPVVTDSLVDTNRSVESSQRNSSEATNSSKTLPNGEGKTEESIETKKLNNIHNWIILSVKNWQAEELNESIYSQENNSSVNISGENVSLNRAVEFDMDEFDSEYPMDVSESVSSDGYDSYDMREAVLSKETSFFVTIIESLSIHEPVYVNLTGIKGFTGQERILTGGCLDLSGLDISGEEAAEVIKRMSKYRIHKIDLSNNNIRELPVDIFSPLAFMIQELRLDGNPLTSGDRRGEGSVLRRSALFNLPELRILNLSNCGLRNIDMFTAWKSDYLEIIDLSGNRLQEVPANLQYFHKLRGLYLADNPVSEIKELPLALLWNLQVLDLTSCQVSSIKGKPFWNMENLKELSLMDNKLTRISEVLLPRSFSGLRMYLSGNPWNCDCDIVSFAESYYGSIYDIEDISCASPWWVQGLHVAYLTKELVSLDRDCLPASDLIQPADTLFIPHPANNLELFSLVVFVLAFTALLVHLTCTRKRSEVDPLILDNDEQDHIIINSKPLVS